MFPPYEILNLNASKAKGNYSLFAFKLKEENRNKGYLKRKQSREKP
jgi:hypothetical protein